MASITPTRADARRDAALVRAGYRLRLEVSLIVSDIEGALSRIGAALLA